MLAGIAVNAATYNWSAANDWFSPDGSADLAGTVYLFDGSANTIAAITGALDDSSTFSKALSSVALDYGGFSVEGTGLTDDGSDVAHMFAVVINDTGDGYWASDMFDVAISDAIKGGQQAVFAFGDVEDIAFTPISSGPTPGPGSDSVPEPTSGLLMLLGMAGLALRRRNA